ncbi:MAG: tRNA 4-thiouridine(8) synthase ThiI [Acholeplasmataceae bacterium]|nr:tRNA 4-thiouridine(8) synthase ThiI [Acholeplasmataceae bacterium]
MKKKIIIRFGDMMLKGRNIGFFIKRVRIHIVNRLSDLKVDYEFTHDRIFIDFNANDEKTIIERLHQIPGLYSFNVAYVALPEIEDVIRIGINVLNSEIDTENRRIKIETRRHDKSFPLTSLEFTQKIASSILSQADKKFIVDVKKPSDILHIDLRKDVAYIYMKSIMGMRGYPYGTAGKGLLMMSGGIDSPIAAYLSIKQGIEIELFHFESTPMTPLESVQKVIDLASVLSQFTPNQKIKLHLVPFTKIHEQILSHVFDPYIITVMRRMMYRLGEKFSKRNKFLCIINGESVGQVASQTLNSMKVVESVTKIPILRPLITYDKNDIVELSKKIGTYEISIRPFNDCCSIYVPKSPVTKPMEVYASKYEQTIDFEPLLSEALQNIHTIEVSSEKTIKLASYGFSVSEAIKEISKEDI